MGAREGIQSVGDSGDRRVDRLPPKRGSGLCPLRTTVTGVAAASSAGAPFGSLDRGEGVGIASSPEGLDWRES